jgi:hypothetical protein
MTVDGAMRVTLSYLFRGDTILNWFLGCVLLVFPSRVDSTLGQHSLAPLLVYQVIGGGFLLFAAWQTVMAIRRRLGPWGLVFAALMAEIPVILLTVVLVFMNLDLLPAWRLVLWLGNGYMLLLGVWYVFVARWLVIKEALPRSGSVSAS